MASDDACACAAAGAPNDVELLFEGGETLRTNKALLGTASAVLREAFIIEPSCSSLKVDGDPQAWRFITAFPLMTTKARANAMRQNENSGAQLMAQVLAVALQYNMPTLLQECLDYADGWSRFQLDYAHESYVQSPINPIFWFHLADQHNMLELAAPALQALVRRSSYGEPVRWCQMAPGQMVPGRASVLVYGRKPQQQTSALWRMVVRVLDGCDR